MLDYQLVKDDYPFAWDLLKCVFNNPYYGEYIEVTDKHIGWFETPTYGCAINKRWNERDLFDFFDMYGYCPSVFNADKDHWGYTYIMDNGDTFQYSCNLSSRQEAEGYCFISLFGLLNLKNK